MFVPSSLESDPDAPVSWPISLCHAHRELGDGMITCQGTRIAHADGTFLAMSGFSADQLLAGLSFFDLFEGEGIEGLRTGDPIPSVRRFDGWLRREDCSRLPVEILMQSAVIQSESWYRFLVRGLEGRETEPGSPHGSMDPVTNLPTGSIFRDRLALALAQARRHGRKGAVMFLNFDRFRRINDLFGYGTGDLVLQGVAQRLSDMLRDYDTVSRMGGDEFLLMLPEVADTASALVVAERLVSELSLPFHVGDHEFQLRCRIGVSLFPTHGEDPTTQIRNANAAMQQAKELDRPYQLFAATMHAASAESLSLEHGLHKALELGEFVLHYQPQVCALTGRLMGAEALVRWQHPGLGLVPPMRFIPLAEELGLIVPLTEWVLQTACAQAIAWDAAGLEGLRVAVNLSGRHLKQAHFVETIQQVLDETGLAPERLELELTESLLLDKTEATLGHLTRLQAMGVRVAIDDFGTGYSSLSYLKHFPVSVLKIDRSFVDGLVSDPDDRSIVESVIDLAHRLRLRVVAEGVETDEHRTLLQAMQCDWMQGYFFSRPLPAGEFLEFARRRVEV